jgi:hypothetical protein
MNNYETLPEEYKRFVDSYVHCLNKRKAYQVAYPAITNANTARTNGCLLAAKPEVKEAIIERLKLFTIDKSETLQRIISLIEFDVSDYQFADGSLNVATLKDAGYGWLIKAVKPTKFGTEYVLMDKDRALENLAKIHQLFDDKSTVNVNINQEISAKQRLEDKLKTLDSKFNGTQ